MQNSVPSFLSPPISPQQAPGTPGRPILSAAEAACFTPAAFLGDWSPTAIDTSASADFVVGPGGTHTCVQEAINAAIRSGKEARQLIRLLPGTYVGVVYVPADAPPLTLVGAGSHPAQVRIELTLDATLTPSEYARIVNPAGRFREGDPAWMMFKPFAERPAHHRIDTAGAAVVWVQAAGFQMSNLTVANTLLDTVDGGTHQAVALRSDGDCAQFEKLRLIGRQDTFLANVGEDPCPDISPAAYSTNKRARIFARDCYIEGDTDFVFGRASAVFERCEFHVVASRRHEPAIVFAPDTLPGVRHGFLVTHCRFTGDAAQQAYAWSFLGRSWDQGASSSGYVPGTTPNGQLVIRDSHIDQSFNHSHPWDRAATSRRTYAGNADPARNLDDPAFNRLWEFNNHGPGAGVAGRE